MCVLPQQQSFAVSFSPAFRSSSYIGGMGVKISSDMNSSVKVTGSILVVEQVYVASVV